MVCFASSLKLGYMWDDHEMIESNIYIKSISLRNIKHIFASDPFNQNLNYYRPLVSLSFMLDFALWKYNPSLSRFVNILIHTANAYLVFLLVMYITGSRNISFMTSVLFAANPVITEQIMIVICRAELLSTMLSLASIILFFKKSRLSYSFSIVIYILALLSKESAAAVPASILCVMLAKKSFRENAYKAIPYFAILPVYLSLRKYAVEYPAISSGFIQVVEFLLLKFPKVAAEYLAIAVFPVNLHSHRVGPGSGVDGIGYLLVMAVLAGYLIKRKQRLILFCLIWFVVQLSTKIPLLAANMLMLDHWAYMSNAGLFLLMAAAANVYSGKSVKTKKILYFAFGAYIVFYAFISNLNIHVRGGDLKLYEHAAKFTSSKPLHYNLAREYYLRGDVRKAIDEFEMLVLRDPENPNYRNGLALSLYKTGRTKEAFSILEKVHAENPKNIQTLYNMAYVDKDRQAGYLHKIIEINPDEENAYVKLAQLLMEKGGKGHAKGLYEKVLALDPYNLEALVNLGAMSAEEKDYRKAEYLWKRALSIDKNNKAVLGNIEKLSVTDVD